MIEFLILYFAGGAIVGTFAWLGGGRHDTVSSPKKIQAVLLTGMIFWPVTVALILFLIMWPRKDGM